MEVDKINVDPTSAETGLLDGTSASLTTGASSAFDEQLMRTPCQLQRLDEGFGGVNEKAGIGCIDSPLAFVDDSFESESSAENDDPDSAPSTGFVQPQKQGLHSALQLDPTKQSQHREKDFGQPEVDSRDTPSQQYHQKPADHSENEGGQLTIGKHDAGSKNLLEEDVEEPCEEEEDEQESWPEDSFLLSQTVDFSSPATVSATSTTGNFALAAALPVHIHTKAKADEQQLSTASTAATAQSRKRSRESSGCDHIGTAADIAAVEKHGPRQQIERAKNDDRSNEASGLPPRGQRRKVEHVNDTADGVTVEVRAVETYYKSMISQSKANSNKKSNRNCALSFHIEGRLSANAAAL